MSKTRQGTASAQTGFMARKRVSVVAIGRNEGERLKACLSSLIEQAEVVVYVDSGSNDGSVAMARGMGVEVVELQMSQPFTAARARNAGYAHLQTLDSEGEYVQFIDGDCILDPGWMGKAVDIMNSESDLAVVCGRRSEKFPQASLWNHLVDLEWNSPVGEAKACGGDALIRRTAFDACSGYRDDLIAGEEPEMCFRLRAMGWRIRRVDAEMTLHDAAMMHVSQWWQRCRRAGHTYAEGAHMHGRSSERYRIHELRRTLIWGLAIPLSAIVGTVALSPWMLLLLLAYPAQIVRLGLGGKEWLEATFLVLGKVAETQGVLGYWFRCLSGRRQFLIEYK